MIEEENAVERVARPSRRQRSKGVWFGVLLVVLLLVIIALLLLRQRGPEVEPWSLERELTAEVGLLPGMTVEEVKDRLNRKVAESMLNVSINPVPVFADGNAEGNLRIENIPGNKYAFVVELVRSDTGDTLLKTGLIDPGHFVENIRLDTALPKGKYLCVARFLAYTIDTLTEVGEAGAQVLITVEA